MNLHLIEMLTTTEFYMSTRSELNDPFDSAYKISLENYLNLYFEKYPSLKSNREHVERTQLCFERMVERGEDNWIKDIDEQQANQRVACFTEDGNNPLMWSHYSSNHTGVCLKFDLSKDSNLNESLLPVTYADELVEVKSAVEFTKCLLTKLRTWTVEKEWRIISDKKKFLFEREALVEIVLGLKVSDSAMGWFRQFRENVYFMHAPVYKLKIKGNRLIKVDDFENEVIVDMNCETADREPPKKPLPNVS
jgi:hypothetical protein